jgi:hypothetical protein
LLRVLPQRAPQKAVLLTPAARLARHPCPGASFLPRFFSRNSPSRRISSPAFNWPTAPATVGSSARRRLQGHSAGYP